MPSIEIQIKETNAFLEGPAVAQDGSIFFSDIANNRIMRFDGVTKKLSVFREPSGRANGHAFDTNGCLLSCEGNELGDNDGNRRITRTDIITGGVEVLTDAFEGKHYNAPNDITAGRNGRIFFTDPCYGDRSHMELSHESVYRIDPDRSVTRLVTQPDIEKPNGLALSPDEKTLYVVDSNTAPGGNRKIWAFDLSEKGDVGNQRLVFDFAQGRGGDGIEIGLEGNLYIAAGVNTPRGGRETDHFSAGIYVVTPSGELENKITVPEDLVTNVAFDGDFKMLYITAGRTLYSHVL